MILIVDALNKDKFHSVLDDMFRLRARVFAGRLGWDVTITDGREEDQFDALDPGYVIGLDEEGNVVACARALQTTGPHMLSDVFHSILDGEPPLRSATLWESTRFCVDTERLGRGRMRGSVSHATSELMLGAVEYAMRSGISDVITVIDPVMDRVLKRSGNAPYDYVGKTVSMGKVAALAALLDCTEERAASIRAHAGIEGDVFLTDEEALALPVIAAAEARTTTAGLRKSPLEAYCDEQIAAATTAKERVDALRLKAALADRVRSHSDISA